MRKVTFVFPIIRTDFIERAIDTLITYTNREDYKIVLVDQSIEGARKGLRDYLYEHEDMYIRIKNSGFSKASNEGIIHALKWNTPYIAVINDDVEFIHQGWFDDAIEEFKTDPKIVAVCPESPRVAMWGYGLNHGEHVELIPHKDEFTAEDITYLKQGDYSKEEVQSRHKFIIPDSFPYTKRGVVDGIAMWCPIFKREALIELGLFEERFIWGGGEDYDLLARAYSCAWPIERSSCEPAHHRRMVSTMKSWVWHWWGQSKDVKETLNPNLFTGKKPWNNLGELYPPEKNGGKNMDPWGHWKDDNGIRRPFIRDPLVFIDPS